MTFPDNVNLRGSVYLVAGASGGIGNPFLHCYTV